MKEKRLIKLFLLFSFYSLLLLIFRIWITDSKGYIFLVWNLFLAYVPYIISSLMGFYPKNRYFFYPLLLIWLFFLPNAPYIVTDIFHLKNNTIMPQWYDLLLVISFAMNGIFLFFISLYDVYKLLSEKYSITISNIAINLIILLAGFGIYLGRYLRWNTWDIITKPKFLFLDITDRILNPFLHLKTWGVTLGYGIFLILGFQFVRIMLSTNRNIKKI